MTMTEKEAISSLSELLVSYNTQLEEYERACGTFTLSIISATTAVVTIAVTLCSVLKLSGWVIVLPCFLVSIFELIFTFVFPHYTRRVAFYRGYCIYLENKLNRLTESRDYFFHKSVAKKTMSVFKGSTLLMRIGCWLLYAACVLLSCYELIWKKICCVFLSVLILIFFAIIGIGIGIFLKALGSNKMVEKEMIKYKN